MWDISQFWKKYVIIAIYPTKEIIMLSIFTVCFFGHRRIDDTKTIETRVEKVIDKILLQHEYVEFLVGRNGEFDQIVSSAVLRSKKRADAGNCSLTWVMPYLSSDYTHNQEDYERYCDIFIAFYAPSRLRGQCLYANRLVLFLRQSDSGNVRIVILGCLLCRKPVFLRTDCI